MIKREISNFTNQVFGKRVLSYNGKLTPMGAGIIGGNEEEERNLRKDIVRILNWQKGDSDSEEGRRGK